MDNIKKEKYTSKELLELDFEPTYEEIFEILKNEQKEDFAKIFAILNLEKINSQKDADIFINLLTNQPNPIREITALKIEELNETKYYLNEFALNKITDAIIDINPNVCRAICNFIENNKPIAEKIEEKLLTNIETIIEKIKKYEKENRDFFNNKIKDKKNHAKNKLLFALYWTLEALSICLSEKNHEKIIENLKYLIKFNDYTIREKTVKIITKIPSIPKDLIQLAKNDVNFYVKNHIYDKISKEIVK